MVSGKESGMSHFTVLVIGPDVDKQLAPYHEFECTGDDNEYVQNIDRTTEALEEYAKHTTTAYQAPNGKFYNRFTKKGDWNMRFFRPANEEELAEIEGKKSDSFLGVNDRGDLKDGRSFFTKHSDDYKTKTIYVQSLPKGWKEAEAPVSAFESATQFIEGWYGHKVVKFGQKPSLAKKHKYGYVLLNEDGTIKQVVDRTNPNKKWDGYQVGGRWNGFFKLKPQAIGAGVVGQPGLNRMDPDYEHPGQDRADGGVMLKEIDLEGMRQEAEDRAAKSYDSVHAVASTAGGSWMPWSDVLKRFGIGTSVEEQDEAEEKDEGGIEAARNFYHSQPAVKALRSDRTTREFWDVDEFLVSRDQYLKAARDGAIATFAVVKDGKWYERGKMGWWACVSDEKDKETWLEQFSSLLDGLPEDTLLTVVDCHI
jgi:hypothetical protein